MKWMCHCHRSLLAYAGALIQDCPENGQVEHSERRDIRARWRRYSRQSVHRSMRWRIFRMLRRPLLLSAALPVLSRPCVQVPCVSKRTITTSSLSISTKQLVDTLLSRKWMLDCPDTIVSTACQSLALMP